MSIIQSAHSEPEDMHQPLSASLTDNMRQLEEVFADCQDVYLADYRFGSGAGLSALVVYCPPLTQSLDHNLLKLAAEDVATWRPDDEGEMTVGDVIAFFGQRRAAFKQYRLAESLGGVSRAVLDGRVALLFEGWSKAVVFNAFSAERRQVDEPTSESVINGPREGTVEQLDKNVALIRLRLKSPRLKFLFYQAGDDTKTRFLVGYLDGAVKPEVLEELKRRLKGIRRVNVLDTNYIREYVVDSPLSPFPQMRVTERPDVAAAVLMEGKIILLAEGSTSIMICPTMFTDLFQSAEDYYQRSFISTLIRALRIISFFIAMTLPSLYIALSDFHPELIPTTLLLTILNMREGIPFPAFIEAIVMQFFFELLREAGIRLPRPIGSAVSIVGALIIGEASIRAGIASPIMIVIISLTGIASFSLPNYELAIALRILLFPLMVLAFLWGGFGLMIGYILIFLHLATLRSLGQPFFSPIAPLQIRNWADVLIRLPVRLRMKASGARTGDN